MEQVTIPYSGTLLVSHLVAYGLATTLDAVGIDAFVGHDPASQSFEPVGAFAARLDAARAAIRKSAEEAERLVEHDIDPGNTGNERRATIWARASLGNDRERLERVAGLRTGLMAEADRTRSPGPIRLLGGLGAPATWGTDRMKTSAGATALDGVLGNHTSDFVRGVLRPTRRAAAELDPDPFVTDPSDTADKTGWAPPGTKVNYVHQWLAAVGLGVLPVAHRPRSGSVTPACWTVRNGRRIDGATLPLLGMQVSVPRLRALLALGALTAVTDGSVVQRDAQRAAGELLSNGVEEVVVFERRSRSGAGSSVAFDFRRGTRIALR